jgi:hypothetical protein
MGIVVTLAVSGCATVSKNIKNTGLDEEEKFYLNPIPLQSSKAYTNYLQSTQNERAKLDYLLDRVRESKNTAFYFEGSQYGWTEACAAGNWLLFRRYEKGDDARTFLKKVVGYTPNQSAFIQPPDGPKCADYPVLMNELELLEESNGKRLAQVAQTT